MNFWNNSRYSEFELGAINGDRLRGEPEATFPWLLRQGDFFDPSGDRWKIEVHCINVEPEAVGKNVQVTIRVHAQCLLSENRIKALGFHPERLELMGNNLNELVTETQEFAVSAQLDSIQDVAKAFAIRFQRALLIRYNDDEKTRRIDSLAHSHPFSRFSSD